MYDGRKSFPDFTVWSDEANFKLNGTINRHKCVYWATGSPNLMEEGTFNLPGTSVWCGMPSRAMLGPFSFEGTATGTAYLIMLEDNIIPCINILFSDEDCYFRHDCAPQHCHTDVRNSLDVCLPGRWIGRRGTALYSPQSPDLTPLGCSKEYCVSHKIKNTAGLEA
jgi:hypothetical protein